MRLPLLAWPGVVLVAALTGCDTDDPTGECTTDTDCPSGRPLCDLSTSTCIECDDAEDCSSSRPHCDDATSSCVECLGDADCAGELICDDATRACVECLRDTDCSNQIFCDGVESCEDGRCREGDPIVCEDELVCTDDLCDEAVNRCVHEPNHGICDNGDPCDGEERCVPNHEDSTASGCVRGTPMRCDDDDDCTDDFCADGRCQAAIRDRDRDGHGDFRCRVCVNPLDPDTCLEGDDCDDNNDAVYPGAVEICDDGFDNNCDRWRDYADESCTILNDSCGNATILREGRPVYGSTRGASADIAGSCGASADRDVVFAFTLTEERDAEITAINRTAELALTLSSACGDPFLERRCLRGREVTMRARGLAPGTWFVVVSTPSEADFELEVSTSDSAPSPDGDVCSTALELPDDGSIVTADLTDAGADYDLSCVEGVDLLDVVYTLEVGEEQTADFQAALVEGSGTVALSVQEICGLSTSERLCLAGDDAVDGRIWRLPPGTYHVILAQDGEGQVELSADLAEVAPGLYLIEDFTSEPAGWTFHGGVWAWGTPSGGGDPTPDEGPCIGTTFGGDYPNNMTFGDDYVETPEIDLTGAALPILEFRAWLDAESSYDGGRLEISADGGAFTILDPPGLAPDYNDSSVGGSSAWTGALSSWQTYTAPLAGYTGSRIRLRFAFHSDSSSVRNGWYVDSVRVYEP